jgi:hypothetical protein
MFRSHIVFDARTAGSGSGDTAQAVRHPISLSQRLGL